MGKCVVAVRVREEHIIKPSKSDGLAIFFGVEHGLVDIL